MTHRPPKIIDPPPIRDPLSKRLHDMEEAGLVRREAAPPPFNVTLFHLTERGEALRPAIEALAAWGGPLIARPIRDDEAFLSHWLKLPFEYHLKDRSPEAGPITLEVRTGDEPMLIEAANGVVQARRGHAEKPDAIITGTGSVILGLLTGRLDLAEARRRGLKVEGSENAVLRVRGERPAQ